EPHLWLLSPRRLLVPELHAGEIALPTSEIEHWARSVGADPHPEWVGAGLVVSVLDDDAIELHSGAAYAELKRGVRILAVAADLVVIDVTLDFFGTEEIPRCTRVDGVRRRQDQQRRHH